MTQTIVCVSMRMHTNKRMCWSKKQGGDVCISKLKNLSQQQGLTQRQVAAKANITVNCYQLYEKGSRIQRADIAQLIAKSLNSTVEELFSDILPKKQNQRKGDKTKNES